MSTIEKNRPQDWKKQYGWIKRWNDLSCDDKWWSIYDHRSVTKEQLAAYSERQRAAWRIAVDVAEMHDSRYATAELRRAENLKQLAYIARIAKNNAEDVKLSLEVYSIYKRVLGKWHSQTLLELDRLSRFYRDYRHPASGAESELKKLWEVGLSRSFEAFEEGGTSSLFARHLLIMDNYHNSKLSAIVMARTNSNDKLTQAEDEAFRLTFGSDVNEANKLYAKLLKEVAWEEGMNSSKLRCLADCYCTSLEAQGLNEEANSIRLKLNTPRSSDSGIP